MLPTFRPSLFADMNAMCDDLRETLAAMLAKVDALLEGVPE